MPASAEHCLRHEATCSVACACISHVRYCNPYYEFLSLVGFGGGIAPYSLHNMRLHVGRARLVLVAYISYVLVLVLA